MNKNSRSFNKKVESILGLLLRTGILLSAFFVLLGGILYLTQFGGQLPHYQKFRGEGIELRNIRMIMQSTFDFHPLSMIQFGLLILFATPVARIVFSVFSFLFGRDYLYVIITLIVLVIVVFSITSGYII